MQGERGVALPCSYRASSALCWVERKEIETQPKMSPLRSPGLTLSHRVRQQGPHLSPCPPAPRIHCLHPLPPAECPHTTPLPPVLVGDMPAGSRCPASCRGLRAPRHAAAGHSVHPKEEKHPDPKVHGSRTHSSPPARPLPFLVSILDTRAEPAEGRMVPLPVERAPCSQG